MLKRSRVRPRNEAKNNHTTTTTTKPLPIVNLNVTASPLFSLKKELKGGDKLKQTQSHVSSPAANRFPPQIKSTTTEAVNKVRRYETPPPRFVKPLSPYISKISKATKTPKLHLLKVSSFSR